MPIGSTWKDGSGYIREKVAYGKGTWRPQHIVRMEEHLRRPLRRGEVVHHINGVRDDNRLENLYLCDSRSRHNAVERTLAECFRELLAEGLVRFDRESGRYERTDL